MSMSRSNTGEIAPAQAVRLRDLVEWSPGSVVSRTLSKSAAGTLTLFAFDDGQGLSEHSAPFDTHVMVLEGAVDLVIGGQVVPANAGEIVRMPAHVPHALTARGRLKMLLAMIRG